MRYYSFIKDTFLNTPFFKLSIVSTLSTIILSFTVKRYLQITKLFTTIYNALSIIGMISAGIYFFKILGPDPVPRASEVDFRDKKYFSLYHEVITYLNLYESSTASEQEKYKKKMESVCSKFIKEYDQSRMVSIDPILQDLWLLIYTIIDRISNYDTCIQTMINFSLHLAYLKFLQDRFETRLFDLKLKAQNETEMRPLKFAELSLNVSYVQPLFVQFEFFNGTKIITYEEYYQFVLINQPLPLFEKNYKFQRVDLQIGNSKISGVLKYTIGTI